MLEYKLVVIFTVTNVVY